MWRCKSVPAWLGEELVPVVHGRAPRATRRALNRLTRRGQDLKFILPLLEDSNTFSRQDPALIQAVAKAHLWWDWIKSGEVKSLSEIARREGIDKPKVTRLLRLSFLSPRLVRRIRDGEQPAGVTVKTLTREHDLPRLWPEQEALVASFR